MIESILRKILPYKDIGWTEVGERFTRYALIKTPWFRVFLHQLYAPEWHPECHDHPWSFWTILLVNGYLEQIENKFYRRWPGMIMYRSAEFAHNVTTPYGTSWSLVFAGPKSRDWGFKPCERPEAPTVPYTEYIKKHPFGI